MTLLAGAPVVFLFDEQACRGTCCYVVMNHVVISWLDKQLHLVITVSLWKEPLNDGLFGCIWLTHVPLQHWHNGRDFLQSKT